MIYCTLLEWNAKEIIILSWIILIKDNNLVIDTCTIDNVSEYYKLQEIETD
ncbi:hypothetical protein HYD75_00825 [Mycoplasmopsis bovis]|nr:hypothetical protein [Mycoplasmopsis bovis]QQH48835.1 hypothetical protein HYD75_00825 [Mycoplasmopsis bovis]